MSTAHSIPPEAIGALRAEVSGAVFVPADPGYDQARRARMLTADQRPAVVVEAAAAADVAAAARFAQSHRPRVAPQSTGHGAAPLESLDGALLRASCQQRHCG